MKNRAREAERGRHVLCLELVKEHGSGVNSRGTRAWPWVFWPRLPFWGLTDTDMEIDAMKMEAK